MNHVLVPYIPRFLLEWHAEAPDARFLELDGTMVFIDLSGFTAMSERLARRGRAGAEEVVGIIGSTFTCLLSAAGKDGRVLKFGGDAVVLFFRGDRHAHRAATAAAAMRRALRDLNPIPTSAGPVRLRMSCGINSGRFHFFTGGSVHRELVVTGPEATRTVEMESAATAGEILVSPATAAELGARFLGAEKAGGHLLARTPDVPPPAAALPAVPGTADPRMFVPREIAEHVLGGGHEPEHRQVTAGFIHFGGVDTAIETRGSDAVAADVDTLMRTVQETFARHEVTFLGTDVDKDGGKIFCCVGAPRVAEDDDDRMLLAMRSVLDAGVPLPLRAGVNRGSAFCGAVGPPFWQTYTVMGDTTNTAARVMSRAAPGEVLATVPAIEHSATIFVLREREPFAAKGKAKPIVAFAIGTATGGRTRTGAVEVPFVGRERECEHLGRALADARRGVGAAVEIVGDTGIGKTRLLMELAARHDARTVAVSSPRPELARPYAALSALMRDALSLDETDGADALRTRVRALAGDLEEWLPLLAIPLGIDLPPTAAVEALDQRTRAGRLRDLVARLLVAALPPGTLITIDDAHRLDDASAAALTRVASDAARAGWLLVAARRSASAPFIAGEPIALGPLPDDDAARIARALAGGSLRPYEIQRVVERAGGNPLFLEELALRARDHGLADDLPESVDALVTARIDTLPPADRLALRYASVLGADVDVAVLQRAVHEEGIELDATRLARLATFLDSSETGRLRFRHALIRDAAYEGLSFRRRRQIHERVASLLESRDAAPDERAELLSWHYLNAGNNAKAWTYARTAGRRSAARFAQVDAVRFFRMALDAARPLPDVTTEELVDVYEGLGRANDLASRPEEAARAFAAGLRIVGDDRETRARLLFFRGQMEERLARYPSALRWYGKGLRSLEGERVEGSLAKWRHRLMLGRVQIELRRARYRQAIRLAEAVARDARETGDEAGVAHAYVSLHIAHLYLGSPERARYRDLPVEVYERIGDLIGLASFLNVLGGEAYFDGRWHDAAVHYRRSAEVARRAGDVSTEAEATNNLAEILSDQGRLDEAEELFRAALEAWRPAEYRLQIAVGTANLGRVAARAGRPDEARALLEEALEAFVALGAQPFVLQTRARVAEAASLAGDVATARAQSEALVADAGSAQAVQDTLAMAHRVRGVSLAVAGDGAEARAAFETAIETAAAAGSDYERALTLAAWIEQAGIVGPPPPRAAEELGELLDRLGVVRVVAAPTGR